MGATRDRPELSLVFEALGVRAEVGSDDPEVFAALLEFLPPGWRKAPGEPGARFMATAAGELVRDTKVIGRELTDRGKLLIRFSSAVRQHLAVQAPVHVFIHAGVVSVGGKAIVIPGASFSGKTTLVAELVKRGATYYSDEYAVVDPEGMIQPFAQPLGLRPPGGNGKRISVPVPEAQTGSAAIPAGLIAVTRYQAGATWMPTAGTPGEGAFALLECTIPARPRPRSALRTVGQLARGARILVGPRGDAGEMAEALLNEHVPAAAIDQRRSPK